jgi:hypothetical protein
MQGSSSRLAMDLFTGEFTGTGNFVMSQKDLKAAMATKGRRVEPLKVFSLCLCITINFCKSQLIPKIKPTSVR